VLGLPWVETVIQLSRLAIWLVPFVQIAHAMPMRLERFPFMCASLFRAIIPATNLQSISGYYNPCST
jgi:hypothetical protein